MTRKFMHAQTDEIMKLIMLLEDLIIFRAVDGRLHGKKKPHSE